MKSITITGLAIQMDVTNNADMKEIQERLDLMNIRLRSDGKIMGIDNLRECDIFDSDEISC